MLRYICIIFLFLTSLIVNAEIYYISPTGNDVSGNGSNRKPWKTLSYACSQVTYPGDVIKLKTGKFIENNICALSKGVSIDGVPRGSTIISNVYDSPLIILLSPESTYGNQYISNLIIYGDDLKSHSAILVSGRSNVSIHHNKFYNFRVSATVFNGSTDTIDIKSRISFGIDVTANLLKPKIYAKENKFFRNEISNCAIFYPNNRAKGALMIGGQNEIQIFDNIIVQNSRQQGHNGYPIKYYRGGHNINPKIYRNTLIKSHLINTEDEFFLGCAIELWHTTGLELYENEITGGLSFTYIKDSKIHHNKLTYDFLTEVPKTGIHMSGDIDNITINNNYFENFALQLDFISFVETKLDNIFIYTNVMYNIGVSTDEWQGSGIRFGGITSDSITNINIINNTIIANPENRNTRIGINLPTTGYASDIYIQNNILSGFKYASIFAAGPDRIIDVISIENNIFWDNIQLNKTYATSDSVYYTNIKLPKKETNQNNIFQNPLFLSPENFELQENSPAINGGLYISWITKDFKDNLINGSKYIGAYAYKSIVISQDEIDLLIYPVPFKDHFTIVIKDISFESGNLEMYDLNGKLIYTQQLTNIITHIYPINLSSGMYIVKITTSKNEILIAKVISF